MKLILALLTFLGVLAFTSPVEAHDETHPESMQAILPGQATHLGYFEEVTHQPDRVTQCYHHVRPTRTSAVAYCYGWAGGSRKFQVKALAWKCNLLYWMYGSVGQVGNGGTITSKSSFVYTPPGGWIFIDSGIVIYP